MHCKNHHFQYFVTCTSSKDNLSFQVPYSTIMKTSAVPKHPNMEEEFKTGIWDIILLHSFLQTLHNGSQPWLQNLPVLIPRKQFQLNSSPLTLQENNCRMI